MKFLKSARSISDLIRDDISEVCFIGRSNVGKSSLINAISNSKVAKTSNTPGRTRLINYFSYEKIRIVDLPGYGYAKVSKTQIIDLADTIETYMLNAKNLKCVFQICDANVITKIDAEMSNFFAENFNKHFVILNKCDKGSYGFYKNKVSQIAEYLNINEESLIFVSAKKRINIENLKKIIFESSK